MNAPLFHLRAYRAPRHEAVTLSPAPARLGEVLLDTGALTEPQLTAALRDQRKQAAPLGEIVVGAGMVSRSAITRALSQMHSTAILDLDNAPPDPRLSGVLSADQCIDNKIVPWRRQGATTIFACAHPNKAAELLRSLPREVQPARAALADERQLERVIAEQFPEALSTRAETRTPAAQSCRGWSAQKGALLCALLLGCVLLGLFAPVGTALFWLATASLLINTLLKIACLARAPRGARPVTGFAHRPFAKEGRLPKISILVPLYKEANIAASLIRRLSKLDYPAPLLEICLITEADDHVTKRALRDIKLPQGMRAINVPMGTLKTKPRAMNYALDFTSGAVIGVYDAEDAPDRDQLYKVARRFAASDEKLACLQGILSFYNPRAGWLARCFSFEYAAWFRIMLPGLQRLGFAIPLGGTTLFFRRDALVSLGGWDAHNVTEDADLGIRLARHGYRCEMIETVTHEEANNRLWPWVKQRSRWLKGYAMTWCSHMRRPLRLWRDLGPWKFLGFQILFLGTLVSFTLAPILWWNMAYIFTAGAVPTVGGLAPAQMEQLAMLFVACEVLTLGLFTYAHSKLTHRPALLWVFTLPFYFMLATLAAYKGLLEVLWKPYFWDKTEHGVSDAENELEISLGVDLEPRFVSNRKMVA
jgi:cellulose synthase/poly-beta-1,6-N-acetylglucosamine synthase-like glycosyltransferase